MGRPIEMTPQRSFDRGYHWAMHMTSAPHPEAALASQIIEKWALVAAVPDGEDSAGRQKCRLPTAQELAERACEIAARAFEQFEQRGWVQDIPSSTEAEKAWKEKHPGRRDNDD